MDRIGRLSCRRYGDSPSRGRRLFPLEVGNRWIYQKYDVRYSDILRVEETPFKGGPEWDWRSGGHKATVSTEVIGQVQLQKRSYFVVRQDWNWFLPDTLYLRKEGMHVFRYLEQPDTIAAGTPAQEHGSPDSKPWKLLDPNQTDWLMYDFEASQGTLWDLPLPEIPRTDVVIWWVLVNARWPGDDIHPSNWRHDWKYIPIWLLPSQRLFRFSSTGYVVEWDEAFEVGIGPIYITHFTTETEFWDFGLLKEAHIGGQTILRDLGDLGTAVEQTSWGQVKSSFEEVLK